MSTTDKIPLHLIKADIGQQLERMERFFVPGARLTFVMRLPGNDDATLVVTSDTAADVVKALSHLIAEGRT